MSLIEQRRTGAVLTLTLNDVARRNALSAELLGELLGAIDAAEADESLRVVVVTNEGSTFCAGANLAEVASSPREGAPGVALADLFRRVRASRLPFVGRLAGHCVAGGVGLAAVLDVSVAIDTASFGFSEVRVGVAPAVISVVCLAKMRPADASEALLLGRRFPAAEAQRLGLINRVVAPERLDDEIRDVVNDLLAGEPNALAATKRLAHTVTTLSEDDAYRWTSELSAELFRGDAAREGIAAFFEKRDAPWVERWS